MKITKPELKVIRFSSEDVIATSLYFMSAADYNAAHGTSFDTPYVWFNGSMTDYDPSISSWRISDIRNVDGMTEEDKGFIVGTYFEDMGVYFPGVGGISYEAFNYNDGLYTKGASYSELYGNQ